MKLEVIKGYETTQTPFFVLIFLLLYCCIVSGFFCFFLFSIEVWINKRFQVKKSLGPIGSFVLV